MFVFFSWYRPYIWWGLSLFFHLMPFFLWHSYLFFFTPSLMTNLDQQSIYFFLKIFCVSSHFFSFYILSIFFP
eukprot:UN10961